MSAIILDIEGTTTPVAFVYDTLFPYARTRLRRYLQRHAGTPECISILQRLKHEHAEDARQGADVPPWDETLPASAEESAAAYVGWLMERDRKSRPLKELQGLIWAEGYSTGELAGEVFDDVPEALRRWHAEGIPVGIFSSGSVLAQKLLFRHSRRGDLTPLLRWYFDTTVGMKTDPESYVRIASSIGARPSTILFVSDAVRELDAARTAGMRTALCVRPGNAAPSVPHDHPTIKSFDQLAV